MSQADVAADLWGRGFSVIALDHPAESTQTDPKKIGKIPVGPWKEFQSRIPTVDEIHQWFGNGHLRNVGIVTGAISGVVVIDCDSPEAIAWADLHLPPTRMITRTKNGDHRFFRHPNQPIGNRVRIPTGDDRIKLDVRGDGGYVVAPGSQHASGVAYTREGDWPPVDELPVFDPTWLEPRPDDRIDRAQKYLDATPPAVEGDGGDAHTFTVCCRLVRGFDLANGEAFELLRVWNARCTPPWAEDDLRVKIQNARQYGDEPVGGRLDEKIYLRTDTGNAEFFESVAADAARYDHARRDWFHWGGQHWQPDRTGEVDRLALASIRQQQKLALAITDDAKRRAHLKWAIDSESRQRRDNLLKLAQKQARLAVTGDDWDMDPMLFGVPNGVIDLTTGLLRDGRPTDCITKVAPIAFCAAAPAPRWNRCLKEIFADHPELADYLQRVVGYSLTGQTTEQVFWILYGEGSNGKSLLMEVIMHVLGEAYSWTMPFPTAGWSNAMSDYQKASLVGQRLLQASEVARGSVLNEELIKSLTGDDTINARHPYGRPFAFRPTGKIFLRVNQKPIIRDQTHAMWRRVKLIPFTQTFPIDKTLSAVLRAESAGILAWAVRGCLGWQRDGLQHPDVVETETKEYRMESDTLQQFIDERCVVKHDAAVGAMEMFHQYAEWCDANQIKNEDRLTQKALGLSIRKKQFGVVEGRAVRYLGIGLLGPKQAPF